MSRRLAKEEHGITDEQLDDMEQADLITWLRAQQKGAPAATAADATVPASTDDKDNKKSNTICGWPYYLLCLCSGKLSGAEKRKQKKDENAVLQTVLKASKEGPKTPLEEFEVGKSYQGTIVSVREIGAYIDIGAARDGFCHVSRLADGFVKSPKETVSVGQVVQARVIDLMLKKNKITLSLQTEQMQSREEDAMKRFRSPSTKKSSNKKSPAKQAARNARRLAAKGGDIEKPTAPAAAAPSPSVKLEKAPAAATGDVPKKLSGAEKRKRRKEAAEADGTGAPPAAVKTEQKATEEPAKAPVDDSAKKPSGAEKRKRKKEAAAAAAAAATNGTE